MKIVCPNCATTYEVSQAAIGAEGRTVRCVRCRGVWFVGPDDLVPEPEIAVRAPAAPAAAAAPSPPPAAAPVPPPAPRAAPAAPAAAPAPAGGAFDDLAAWGLGGNDDDVRASSGSSGLDEIDAAFSADLGSQPAVPAGEAPPLVPVDDWQGAEGDLTRPAGAGPTHAGGRPRQAPAQGWFKFNYNFKLRAPNMPTIILIELAIIVGLIGWRADVVRVMPQTGALFAAIGFPVNLRGLALQDVKATKELQDGVPVLVIEGHVVNVSRLMLEVPRIRFAMRNAAGNEVYNWTTLPTHPILPPYAEQPFRTRLASPPAEGRDVTVRFFSRRDAIGGLR